MDESMELSINELSGREAQSVHDLLHDGLTIFNARAVGSWDFSPLILSAQDNQGKFIGGLSGNTGWQWLQVHLLWIDEEHRHAGIGRRLLRTAEALAIQRGCRDSYLNTFDFQAQQFYEREGYTVYGVQEGHPPRHRRFHMRKVLVA